MDLNGVREMAKELGSMHGTREHGILNLEYLRKRDPRRHFATFLRHQDKKRLYVAVEGGRPVGYCMAELIKLSPMYNERRALYIEELFVAEGHRRKGIARRLLAEAERFARSKNVRLSSAKVYGFNTTSQRLFEGGRFRLVHSEYYKILR